MGYRYPPTTEQWKPDELRGSRPVLRETIGEVPVVYLPHNTLQDGNGRKRDIRQSKSTTERVQAWKIKIIYCKGKDRKKYPVTEFDFLGYTFRRLFIKDRLGRLQFNFLPSVSKSSVKAFRDKIKAMRIHRFTGSKIEIIEIIAEMINLTVRGWLNCFKYNPSAVKYSIECLNRRLVK